MRWRVAVFGTLGALATMLAAAVLLAPEVVLAVGPVDALVTALSGTDPTTVMLVATGIVGLYVAVAARTGGRTPVPESSAETRFDDAVTNPPEAVTADQRTLTAADLDADVAVAIERGGEPLRAVRTLLADLAADAYADRERVTPEEARQAVETGAWTGERLAAVFLAGPSGPAVSWSGRIRLWLTPERERERRIERTLAAIDAVQEAGA